MDWSDPLIRNGRSIIFDLQTCETLMVAPIKSLMIDDFKAKYPEDYKVMASSTLSTRTMVKELILKVELGIK